MSFSSFAQRGSKNFISAFQLAEKDLPEGYQFVEGLACKTAKLNSFYKNIELYQNDLGEVAFKGFQSIEGNGSKGSILYFQFKSTKDIHNFLEDYLWGKAEKPSAKHPEEYLLFVNEFLIIWSLDLESPIKKISATKIEGLK